MNPQNPEKEREFTTAEPSRMRPLAGRSVSKRELTAIGEAPRICVIGAGPSGLVTLRKLKAEGLSPVCFEMGGDVGGLWVFQNSNGRGGAYRTLHINTSVEAMEFSDFPMRRDIGKFPHHRHMAAYFRDYAARFDLMDSIRFHHEVVHCQPRENGRGGYVVSVLSKKDDVRLELSFDVVIVANGHHWAPALPTPNPAENFSGAWFHSNAYVDPTTPHALKDKDVVVVGIGNSAVDIACEASRVARSVILSTRRGAWVLPKFFLGKPIDQGNAVPLWLPSKWRRQVVTTAFRMLHGRMSDFGLPEPDHLIGEAHPTVSSELTHLVANGDIEVRPRLERCRDDAVYYADGSQSRADAIVFGTGYDVSFPFFDRAHVSAPQNELPLFLRVFHLQHRHVFFVGLLQTVGAVMPSAELQATLIAKHVSGQYNLPDEESMHSRVQKHKTQMRKRFVPSRRHTMQVIPEDFAVEVRKELLVGARRAQRGTGVGFPVRRGEGP